LSAGARHSGIAGPTGLDAAAMLFRGNAAWLIFIVNGRGRRAAVPVVPRSLSFPPVTADPGAAPSSYDMNAAFMSFQSFQPHESGIHALWSGSGGVSVTEVRFRCAPRPAARRERTKINLT
jgi:hypothetical protein